LEEAVDELPGWESEVRELMGLVVAIAEGDLSVGESFQAAVGDGDSEDVAGQVLEDLVAGARVAAMNGPLLSPGRRRGLPHFQRFQPGAELGAKDGAQGVARHQKTGMPGGEPSALGGEPASGNQEMNVGVEEHRAGPGVEHGQDRQGASDPLRVPGQFLQSGHRRPHQQAVDGARMGLGQRAKGGGQGEAQQLVAGRQEPGLLFLQPSLGLLPVTFGAVSIGAGMMALARHASDPLRTTS